MEPTLLIVSNVSTEIFSSSLLITTNTNTAATVTVENYTESNGSQNSTISTIVDLSTHRINPLWWSIGGLVLFVTLILLIIAFWLWCRIRRNRSRRKIIITRKENETLVPDNNDGLDKKLNIMESREECLTGFISNPPPKVPQRSKIVDNVGKQINHARNKPDKGKDLIITAIPPKPREHPKSSSSDSDDDSPEPSTK